MTPEQATKVEAVTEAIEEFCLQIATCDFDDPDYKRARKGLKDALAKFLAPSFRVIEGARPQKQQKDGPIVKCGKCKKAEPCMPSCKAWAAAVRRTLESDDNDIA